MNNNLFYAVFLLLSGSLVAIARVMPASFEAANLFSSDDTDFDSQDELVRDII
ncbi:hypothetical protein [Algicella marina]|uniref:Uncharacterized protein n=1 Tax=Algicella marina TaxID=2683284 RepID=A0A6P1T0L8_9RHOB|nr:hypothetical protein [Algicella marina]QHQ36278.1 hypothetical protein GO499_14400 [Algicella marina]